jgi:hypothetical protein
LNNHIIKYTSFGGKQYNGKVVDEYPDKPAFYDGQGKVVIDPSAIKRTAGVLIDSNEFKGLCMDFDKDPDGAKIQLKNIQSVLKELRKAGHEAENLIEKAGERAEESDDEWALLEKMVSPEEARHLAKIREDLAQDGNNKQEKFSGARYEVYKTKLEDFNHEELGYAVSHMKKPLQGKA